MNAHFAVEAIKSEMAVLLAKYPELVDDEILRADMFEAETDLKGVLEKLCEARADAESMVEALKMRAADIAARKARFAKRADASKELIVSLMERAGLSKMRLAAFDLSFKPIGPRPIIKDESSVPFEYFKHEIMKSAINDAVKRGETIPGVTMDNGSRSFVIRTT